MQNKAGWRGRTHGIRNLEEPAEDRLRELVCLGIRHDEEHSRREERILGLQEQIQHLLFDSPKNPTKRRLRRLNLHDLLVKGNSILNIVRQSAAHGP